MAGFDREPVVKDSDGELQVVSRSGCDQSWKRERNRQNRSCFFQLWKRKEECDGPRDVFIGTLNLGCPF